jgi:DNA-binding XRE family transcriptional regulator
MQNVELDGERIFAWRWRSGATQERMAEMAGISPSTLRRAENGRGAVTLDTARKIARVLEMETEFLELS